MVSVRIEDSPHPPLVPLGSSHGRGQGVPLLEARHLTVRFPFRRQVIRAVNGVSFSLAPGERLAVLGETGCGKSVMALALLRLLPAGATVEGRVCFAGLDLLQCPETVMRKLRGESLVLIPQNPLNHLNPVLSVGSQVREAVARSGAAGRATRREKAHDLLQRVGFEHPGAVARMFPHQLSGGMAQRVLLAMGLAGVPRLVMADEPTRGLDVAARDRFLELIGHLPTEAGLLIITHDFQVAAAADRIMVMYAGCVVEEGPCDGILQAPRHPYTRGLLAAHPDRGLRPIPGGSPNPAAPPDGCRFHPRCMSATVACRSVPPERRLPDGGTVWCHHVGR